MTAKPAGTATDSAQLLLIEDDHKLCRLVKSYLEPLGYQVAAVHNGREGLARALAEEYDAVILDVMLPGLNGFELLKRLRETSTVPVLMLTGLGDEADRIAGLEIGADDYIPKTFSTRELLARLRAVIRRARTAASRHREQHEAAIVIGPLCVDAEAHKATLDGQPLTLTWAEFGLLLCLARGCGRVQTREHLLLEVAERDFEVFDRSIDVHISSLRRKLGDDPKTPRFIQTVRSAGYVMLKNGAADE
ncbi:MAG TPA: response regulator transcription factor [Bryobacteraceae bacterium]|nr:response regulator transcription factor [Bryobacteraceae bacterium]